jgi:hypothetical protein
MNFGSAICQIILFTLDNEITRKADIKIYIQTMDYNTTSLEKAYVADHLFTVNIFLLNTVFLIIASCFHVYYARYRIKYKAYIAPKLRWVEYGIITPLMFFQIVIICGVRDLLTCITLVTLVGNSMIFGYIQDKLSGVKVVDWGFSPHEWGYFSYLTLWGIALTQFFREAAHPTLIVEGYIIFTVYMTYFSQVFFAVIQFYFVVIPAKLGYERIDDESILEMDGAVHLLSLWTKMFQTWIPTVGILMAVT